MPNELKGQLALITGATGGIGRATSLALADLGCDIGVHYHANSDAAKELVTVLREKGVRAEAFGADLRRYDEVCVDVFVAFILL
jgi:3-oxoacyl-[acyl-carrier protein] reductase